MQVSINRISHSGPHAFGTDVRSPYRLSGVLAGQCEPHQLLCHLLDINCSILCLSVNPAKFIGFRGRVSSSTASTCLLRGRRIYVRCLFLRWSASFSLQGWHIGKERSALLLYGVMGFSAVLTRGKDAPKPQIARCSARTQVLQPENDMEMADPWQ